MGFSYSINQDLPPNTIISFFFIFFNYCLLLLFFKKNYEFFILFIWLEARMPCDVQMACCHNVKRRKYPWREKDIVLLLCSFVIAFWLVGGWVWNFNAFSFFLISSSYVVFFLKSKLIGNFPLFFFLNTHVLILYYVLIHI